MPQTDHVALIRCDMVDIYIYILCFVSLREFHAPPSKNK